MNINKPTCSDCRYYLPDGFCNAPIPMWVEMEWQEWEVGPDDDASDCPCFKSDDDGTP